MLRFAPSLLFALLSLASAPARATENGGSRGGGNASVCFDDAKIASALRKGSHEAVFIPDSALAHVTRISILDLDETREGPGGKPNPLILPARDVPRVDQMAQIGRAELQTALEAEYDRLVSRYDRAIPQIHDKLLEAKAALPIERLATDEPVDQLNDFLQFRSDPKCVVSTMFNQWQDPETGKYHWSADPRLMLHPAHSFASLVASLLHERVYWIGREHLFIRTTAAATYFFAQATMLATTPYGEAIRYYNQLFLDSVGAAYVSYFNPATLGPSTWVGDLVARFNAATNGMGALPGGKKLILENYDKVFRAEVLAYDRISAGMRKEVDKNLRAALKGKPVTPMQQFNGWPADFTRSPLPMPRP